MAYLSGTICRALNELFRAFALLGLGLAVVGCQTLAEVHNIDEQYVGQGPLIVSGRTYDHFRLYRLSHDPAYFAVSPDGNSSGWTSCPGGPDGCDPDKPMDRVALEICEEKAGVPCKLLSRGWDILWEGPLTYTKDAIKIDKLHIVRKGMNPELSSLSIKDVCSKAVDYSKKPYEWSKEGAASDYVREATGRNISIYQCAFETGHL